MKKNTKHGILVNILLIVIVAIILNLKITVWRGNTRPHASVQEKDSNELYTQYLPSDSALWKHIEYMNDLGSRLTGSHGHQKFVRYIRKELNNAGITTHINPYRFEKWEAKHWRLSYETNKTAVNIPTSFYFPYSGSTSDRGVTAELVDCGTNLNKIGEAAGKIALVEVEPSVMPYTFMFRKRSRFPEDTNLPLFIDKNAVSVELNKPELKLAAESGVLGIICVMKGLTATNAANQYLPFTTTFGDCPTLWVAEEQLDLLKSIASDKQRISLMLQAEEVKDAISSTVYAVIPGMNDKETIIINTHTDGTNALEENGAVALIELAKYYNSLPLKMRNRTLVFVFATGHYQLAQFGVKEQQATSRWMTEHPEYWDGQGEHRKAVAGITIEQLGGTEWRDNNGLYEMTDSIEIELVYTANKSLDAVYMKAIENRKKIRTITLRPHNGFYFGEGEPLFKAGIPTISLTSMPSYLSKVDTAEVIHKIDKELIYEQTDTFRKIISYIDALSTQDIGEAQRSSYGFW